MKQNKSKTADLLICSWIAIKRLLYFHYLRIMKKFARFELIGRSFYMRQMWLQLIRWKSICEPVRIVKKIVLIAHSQQNLKCNIIQHCAVLTDFNVFVPPSSRASRGTVTNLEDMQNNYDIRLSKSCLHGWKTRNNFK